MLVRPTAILVFVLSSAATVPAAVADAFASTSPALATFASGVLASPTASNPEPPWVAVGTQAMVASDSPLASQAGAEILGAGGNAVDAAAATSFALGVTRPYSTGLGGGGFMIIYLAGKRRTVLLDFRETAPAATTQDIFVRARSSDRSGPNPSTIGGLAVATPGLLAGHARALAEFGTMPLARVIAPALRVARRGYPADAHFADRCRATLRHYERHPDLKVAYPYVYKHFLRSGRIPEPGELIKRPYLARALELIARQGSDAFYRGPIAHAVVAAVHRAGGQLTLADLAAYQPKRRQPIRITYRGYELLAMPPPSSGGTCLAQILNVLGRFDLASTYRRDDAAATHLVVEAMKHAFADRARWLADADFVPVPVEALTNKAYAARIAERIVPARVQPIATYGSPNAPPALEPPDDGGTSHFCVVDPAGNVVASTETINLAFGSLVAADAFGVILNNEMDDFTPEPGKPNEFGLVQSARNAPAPGKRPLSSMSPTIVLRDGRPVLALGASGGPKIITSTLWVLLGVLDFHEPLPAAIQGLRAHHQWQPDEIRFDRPPPAALAEGLRRRGHTINPEPATGIVQAIHIVPGRLTGASDPRKGGRPAGF